MALEGQDLVEWVYDRLAADTGAGGVSTLLGGRIYRDLVPQEDPLPALTVTLVSHVDVQTIRGGRVFANTQVDVHLHNNGTNYGPINVAATRVDVVLQGSAGSKGSTHVVRLVREAVRAYNEDDAGKVYCHVVMTYSTPAYA